MKTTIYCKVKTKGIHSFYLDTEGKQYFLFQQDYRKGVQEYFNRGVILSDAFSFSRSHNNTAIIKTMEKLMKYIKYVEKEHSLAVLNQTQKKKNFNKRKYVA